MGKSGPFRAVAAAVLVAVSLAGCSTGGEGPPEERYYVSLGDSLAVGVQPDGEGGVEETSDGYTDVLFRSLHDADSTLRHERLGCGGEDTTSFIEGGVEDCGSRYTEGTQLAQAERFLEENRDRVDLVTLDIGGNNFTGCVRLDGAGPVTAEAVDEECVEDGLDRLESEIPEIATRLRDAAGPDVQLIGMTYYNPFLAALLLEDGGGSGGGGDAASGTDELVDYATGVLADMNDVLRSSYGEAGFEVADVEEAFASEDFSVPEGSETELPANVQAVCDRTWMCNTADGPDIHTNQAGAALIAETFEQVVRSG